MQEDQTNSTSEFKPGMHYRDFFGRSPGISTGR